MLLNWRLHQNPIVNSASPLLLDLSAENLTFNAARFSTIAQGGYGDATVGLSNPPDALVRDAVENWLMRRVMVTDVRADEAYQGFVAGVRATMGHHIYIRSMEQFANYIYGEYQYAGHPCPKGGQCKGRTVRTETNVDTGSVTAQELGVKELWYTIGQGIINRTQAIAGADVKLHEMLKKRGVDINTEQLQPNSIELMIWGPISTLKFRKHTLAISKQTDIGAIVRSVLTKTIAPFAEASAPFLNTADLSNIQDTGKLITFNITNEPIWVQDYIQQVMVSGDSNGHLLFFQIWRDRKPFLFARPDAPRYYSRNDDDRLYDAARNPIPDYLVHAGGDVLAENADVGIGKYTDVLNRRYRGRIERTEYDDLREKVTIPAPTEVTMTDERLLARVHHLLSQQ